MSSTDQPRWFSHPHHPAGIPASTPHPEVSLPGAAFTSGMTPGSHHPSLNPYIEPGGYLEDMENYLHHHSQPGYYGFNVQQYRAVHHRSISGKSEKLCLKIIFFASSWKSKNAQRSCANGQKSKLFFKSEQAIFVCRGPPHTMHPLCPLRSSNLWLFITSIFLTFLSHV